jgi:hypothetical protein
MHHQHLHDHRHDEQASETRAQTHSMFSGLVVARPCDRQAVGNPTLPPRALVHERVWTAAVAAGAVLSCVALAMWTFG